MNVQTTRILGKLITLSLITSTMIHATNGDNLIAVGTKARGMGGTGIAVSHGAESGLGNAALITSVEGTEIAFGGTVFMPEIKTGFNDGPLIESDADMNMIPEVSIAHKIDDNWYIGIGMWGTAGMGTDYADAGTNPGGNVNMHMVTNLQLMQFGVPIAYKTGGLSVAVTPILQYGNLDIDFDGALMMPDDSLYPVAGHAGLDQEFGFGYNIGIAYDFAADGVPGLTVGATYKSSIEMDYDDQLASATADFEAFGVVIGDTLEQPEEYGVGIAYEMGQHTFAFDYRKIKWSDAKGYGDGEFNWDDSNVYAVGYAYTENEWTIRLGYNHADSAVVEQDASGANAAGAAVNFFNLLGMPATGEDHYTVGASYEFSKMFSIDLAYVYQDKNTETFSLEAMNNMNAMNPSSITTSHEENSISFQLAYKF